jgi:hypothetical protein
MLLKNEVGMAFCVFMVTIGIDCDTLAMSLALDGSPLHPELTRSFLQSLSLWRCCRRAGFMVCIATKTGV